MARLEVKFPGNKKVNVMVNGFEVKTDQPLVAGGEQTAPTPFDLFLSSIAACAGIYLVGFFENRKLDLSGVEMYMDVSWNREKHRVDRISINVKLPESFPEKYIEALKHSIDLCTVKRTIKDPPEFETVIKK